MNDFNKYFNLAIKEANKSVKYHDVPIGCVIVDKNTLKVVSKSANLVEKYNNPLMHAEIIAIKKATKKVGKNLSNCIAFVTLSPCVMCATAFTYTRIDDVYYCTLNPKSGSLDKCQSLGEFDKNLYKTKFHFIENDFTSISKQLLKDFFKNLRESKKLNL